MIKRIAVMLITTTLLLFSVSLVVSAEDNSPIIIIPGYFGSKLFSDYELNNRVFGETGDISEFVTVRDAELFVKPPINLQKAAEFGAGNKYKLLANELCDKYPKRKIYFYSYNFTNGSLQAATLLESFIDSLEEKPTIICDSFGGIVIARYFSLNSYNSEKVSKTICIGVPFEGSIYAQLAVDTELIDLSYISELMPTKKYLEKVSNEQGVIRGAEREFLYDGGKPFMTKTKNVYYAFGGGFVTASQVKYNDNGEICDVLFDNNGDGTVTQQSLTMMNSVVSQKDDLTATFNLRHEQLISSKKVIDWIVGIINGDVKHQYEDYSKGYDVIKINGDASICVTGGGQTISDGKAYFENNDYGDYLRLSDNQKIAAVTRGENYVKIKGNSNGFLNLYFRRYNKDNNLICDNAFMQIPMSKGKVINAAFSDEDTWMYIDVDDDGVFEESVMSPKNDEFYFITNAPQPSVKSGIYKKPFKLKLESKTPDCEIYYTSDGTDPLTNGILYNGEIDIKASCTITAVCVKENYDSAEPLILNYTIEQNNKILIIAVSLSGIFVVLSAVVLLIKKRKNNTFA